MKSNTPLRQEFQTATGWRHLPVIEQFILLKRKVALGDVSGLGLCLFAIVLALSSAAIIKFDIKRVSDFGGIFVLYLATLMLALQPEGTPEDTGETLRVKQKRHLRIALGFVVFGTMMQISSFHLDGQHSTEEMKLKAAHDGDLGKVATQISLAEGRLKELETKNAVLAQNLDKTKSDLESLRRIAEGGFVTKSAVPGNVTHATRR